MRRTFKYKKLRESEACHVCSRDALRCVSVHVHGEPLVYDFHICDKCVKLLCKAMQLA
jgi:hypothetical protein